MDHWSRNEQGKKKTHITIADNGGCISGGVGGGSIGGLVVWGGALAFGCLIAASSITRKKRSKKVKKRCGGHYEAEKSKGLRFLLQNSMDNDDPLGTTNGTSKRRNLGNIDSSKMVFPSCLILEEKYMEINNEAKEKYTSIHEEPSIPIISDSESEISRKAIEEKQENEKTEIADAEKEDEEGRSHSLMGSDEEEEDDVEEKHVMQQSDESSEDTGDWKNSCITSNAEAIWPLELIETTLKLQTSAEKIEEENETVEVEKSGYLDSRKKSSKNVNIWIAKSSYLRRWILTVLILVLMLLLSLVTHQRALSYYFHSHSSFEIP